MQIIRNIKTGLEFQPTPDLLRFAKNPRNNLEVIEIIDTEEESTPPLPPAPPAQEPPVIESSIAPDEVPAPNPELEVAPELPLSDGPEDGFAPPPPAPPAKKK